MRRRRALPGLLLVLALAGLAALLVPGDGAPTLAGPAQVVDADTLVVAGQRVRLHGVDAPEAAQTCLRDGLPWRCGAEATEALRRFLGARPVACTPLDRDRYGRVVARCRAGGQELGAWLVEQGLAVAATDHSWRYLPEELRARAAGRGLWAGEFQRPAEFRRAPR